MFELVYCSVAQSNLTSQDIQDILETSKKFNSDNQITGCLLYHDHEFLQVLEGDQQVVQDLFISIKKDLRHFNVLLLAEGEKESRTFAKWSMAYLELNANEIQKHGFIKDLKAFSQLADKPTHAIDLFWTMAVHILND